MKRKKENNNINNNNGDNNKINSTHATGCLRRDHKVFESATNHEYINLNKINTQAKKKEKPQNEINDIGLFCCIWMKNFNMKNKYMTVNNPVSSVTL